MSPVSMITWVSIWDTLFNLPGRYDELSEGMKKRLAADFDGYGLELKNLYINSITPPPDVQQAIDDRGRLGVFDDLNKLMKMKAAMALEKAAEGQGEAGAGVGMGMGLMMPAMFHEAAREAGSSKPEPPAAKCGDCGKDVPGDSRFLPLLRRPDPGAYQMRQMRQESAARGQVLSPLRRTGQGKGRSQDLSALQNREPGHFRFLQPMR